jgi:hypothetical protein
VTDVRTDTVPVRPAGGIAIILVISASVGAVRTSPSPRG